jgi:hypothetical protein
MFFKKKYENPIEQYVPWLHFYKNQMQSFFYTPYIMQTQIPKFRSKLVNTDRYGLRFSCGLNDRTNSFDHLQTSVNYNLFLGGSTAFGWGAQNGDIATIPSNLAAQLGSEWLNMGVCGQTLQGNLVHLMFLGLLPNKVNDVIFMGGFNELAVFINGSHFSMTFGNIYEDVKFYEAMNNNTLENVSRDSLYVGDFISLPRESERHLDAFKASVVHSLKVLKLQSEALNARLHYFLQPFPSWMDRILLDKEVKIWDWCVEQHLRALKPHFYDQIAQSKRWYPAFLKNTCQDLDIPFTDLNVSLSDPSVAKTWMFIDPGHMTDECNVLIANIISSKLA